MLLSFVCVITLALGTTASPLLSRTAASPFSFPLTRRLNATGTKNILARDQARVRALKADTRAAVAAAASPTDFPLAATNGVVSYTAEVGIGVPATTYTLLVDTGSSLTWVGAGKPFLPSESTTQTGQTFEEQSLSGFVQGKLVIDTVQLGNLTIAGQTIGICSSSEGFDEFDGVLGIGPTDLTPTKIPTVTDTAFAHGSLAIDGFGLSFAPTVVESDTNGEIIFGGVDTSLIAGEMRMTPLTTTSPSNQFVGIDQSITYGTESTLVLAETAGIIDAGTTLILIASDALATYQKLTGAMLDATTGLLTITAAQFEDLQSLFFNIGGVSYELTPNAQLFPRALNTAIGGQASAIYLIISDVGTNSGEGLDFVHGVVFLERFYLAYDSGNAEVGLANTPFTFASSN